MVSSEGVKAWLTLICESWVILIGVFLIWVFMNYDKARTARGIGDFFIRFSFIRRTKSILLSYGIFGLFVGFMGLIMTLASWPGR